MIGRDALAMMKPDALLINTGRAWLVDYPALREALANARLGGAGLDVFETEPPDPKDRALRDAQCRRHASCRDMGRRRA